MLQLRSWNFASSVREALASRVPDETDPQCRLLENLFALPYPDHLALVGLRDVLPLPDRDRRVPLPLFSLSYYRAGLACAGYGRVVADGRGLEYGRGRYGERRYRLVTRHLDIDTC